MVKSGRTSSARVVAAATGDADARARVDVVTTDAGFPRATRFARAEPRAWLGAAAACFQRVEFRAANLTAAEDGYPYGASHVFYAVHADMFADRRVRHFFYTEPDNAPIRARWADALQALVQTERFWVKGSAVRGPAKVDEWVIRHVNGNALYDAHDAEFRAVVREASRAAPRMHARLDPYDLALAANSAKR